MKKEKSRKIAILAETEVRNVQGGYAPPTEEQLEQLREMYGPFAECFICW